MTEDQGNGGPSHAAREGEEGASPAESAAEPVFRALRHGERRHALRLEPVFWTVLEEMARQRQVSVGTLVGGYAERFRQAKNLSSVLRVQCLEWLEVRRRGLEDFVGTGPLNALVQAAPSPVFALSRERKVVAYNAAFLMMIQAEFSLVNADVMQKGLRLSLDQPIEDILRRLEAVQNQPLRTGFVLGIAERRLRRELNVLRAPVAEAEIILGYVLAN